MDSAARPLLALAAVSPFQSRRGRVRGRAINLAALLLPLDVAQYIEDWGYLAVA